MKVGMIRLNHDKPHELFDYFCSQNHDVFN